jgi:hypothetical protein
MKQCAAGLIAAAFGDGPATILGSPLVSPGFAGCHGSGRSAPARLVRHSEPRTDHRPVSGSGLICLSSISSSCSILTSMSGTAHARLLPIRPGVRMSSMADVAAAILGLLSACIFLAHALETHRTRPNPRVLLHLDVAQVQRNWLLSSVKQYADCADTRLAQHDSGIAFQLQFWAALPSEIRETN